MRRIDVSTSVFSAIWARRAEAEETENDILERVLGVHPAGSKLDKSDVEVVFGKINWRNDVKDALEELGGKAHLSEIYKVVKVIRKRNGRSLPANTEAIIRRELENNSSDSQTFKQKNDWFLTIDGIGSGVWGLKKIKISN